ncbi:erythromycin esterase family protein [Nocardia sp. CDC153]|uniref:erythromycin esterase family protein n=1 Tax=Nocardia sp. CDC153 TaxID=3112167 RepID=UPI002DBFA792|nr:erythromycin esterase family protein [Nocardia sp. CDC153]MEC3957406.1 erythromycin esterase family protein [Nocardia sp. CDC153]
MTPDIQDFIPASCDLLGLGEPTHQEPAFARIRNELLPQLVERGFRSIALEIDRVAALGVNDYVQGGSGTLEDVVREGFSHEWGEREPNRQLVAWIRDHNRAHPRDAVTFHGFDAPTENYSAPSPRTYLEHARDYLKLDHDIAALAGDDHRWSRQEAVLDPAMSPGATPEAKRLRDLGEDMLFTLYRRAADLIATTSRAEWFSAETHLTAALGLLRYHAQCAEPLPPHERLTPLIATRDTLMAQNLLAIRRLEARRGPTLVCSHNLHLQRGTTTMPLPDQTYTWSNAASIIDALDVLDYTFIAGSLGRSKVLDLGTPDPGSYEGVLDTRTDTRSLTPAAEITGAHPRTDPIPHGHFPLTADLLDRADAILHVREGATN